MERGVFCARAPTLHAVLLRSSAPIHSHIFLRRFSRLPPCTKCCVATAPSYSNAARESPSEVPRADSRLDDELSMRQMDLDPRGYFIIKLDRTTRQLVLEHYTNTINKNGEACDPDSGEPIPCTAGHVRLPKKVYRGHTAKELSVVLLEREDLPPISRLEHANYLGRELQRAELALTMGWEYVQD